MRALKFTRTSGSVRIQKNRIIVAVLAIAGIGVFPVLGHESCEERDSAATLEILAGSQATVGEAAGTEPIPIQSIPIGRYIPAPPDPAFTLLNRIVLPDVEFAFGQWVDLSHEGPTVGKFIEADGDIDIVILLKVTDENGVNAEVPYTLSTRERYEYPCGPAELISGEPRDSSGQFKLVGLDAVPGDSGSLAACKRIELEIYGEIAVGDGDSDLVEDFVDNCPGFSNNGQTDSDSDGIGDDCDNCFSAFNTSQRDTDGDSDGDACDPWLVNFQPSGAPIPIGYTADGGGIFSCVAGSGWDIDLTGSTRDREICSDQRLDTLIFSMDAKWEIELPNGDYQVEVGVGDCGFPQGPHLVEVEGIAIVDGILTGGAQPDYWVDSDTVPLRDGFLTVEIGNGLNYTTINYLDITPMGEDSQPGLLCSVNFQPDGEPNPDSFMEDNGLVFDESRGYGWDPEGPFMETRDRGQNCRQILDSFTFTSPPNLWEFETPNGFFEVTAGVGDEMFGQGPHHLVVEGQTVFDGEMTAAGQHLIRTRPICVQDGMASMTIGDEAGNTILNFATIATAPIDIDGDAYPNDGDGCFDGDNCPFVANNQDDTDLDGIGDACDLCTDTDGDGSGNSGFPLNTCPLDCDEDDKLLRSIPVEVTAVVASGDLPVRFDWFDQRPDVGLATDFEMATGTMALLGGGTPFGDACLKSSIPGNFYEDDRILSPGEGFYYLFRGMNDCGDGEWGTGTTPTNYRESLSGKPSCGF